MARCLICNQNIGWDFEFHMSHSAREIEIAMMDHDYDEMAYEQGRRDGFQEIYFNPYVPGTFRARSYNLGNS